MTGLFGEPDGATPLDHDDRLGLLRTDIATREELNQAEAENIAAALQWAFSSRRTLPRFLTQAEIKTLHRRMFGDVWRWAGDLRRRETNIGVEPYRIATELESLLRDVQAQTADAERLAYPADELAVRFHHRLVSIHLFPNGNGRHARLAADVVVVSLGRPRFSWGSSGHLAEAFGMRNRYLAALRAADRDRAYEPLLEFARS